jgi:hypothetical protein
MSEPKEQPRGLPAADGQIDPSPCGEPMIRDLRLQLVVT